MKTIKQNLKKITMYFILFQPIIDLLTSISLNYFNLNITFGVILRTLFMIFIVFVVTFIYKKKIPLIYYFIIAIYILLFVLGIIKYKESTILLNEIQGLMRTFYFPIMLMSFYSIKEEINIKYKWLLCTLFIYIILIFVPNILNIGFNSYEIAKEGSSGFFNSANEISAIISILTPLLFVWLEERKNWFLKIIILFIYIFVILTIGTKTPLLALIISTFFYTIWKILTLYKKNMYNFITMGIVVLLMFLMVCITILPKTAFYKNIKIHLDFLNITNPVEILKDPMLIDHFIFSQRLTFLDDKNILYEESNMYEKIIGIGYFKDNKLTKMVEIDYFDIFYSHGMLGFIIYFVPYTCILLDIFKEKKKERKELLIYTSIVSIILILLLSFFTGHIVTAPAVSTFVIFLIFLKKETTEVPEKNKKNIEVIKMDDNKTIITDNNIKVSIIVPIYNSSKYLEKCIKSLLSQTMEEIEIILINDGSTDDSEKIITSFVDKRIRYFKHTNQGIGKTRNFGIRKAKGNYIIFVDSDDYIKQDMCQKMYEKAIKNNLELVVCDFYRDNNGILTKDCIESFENSSIETNPELITKINLGPCNKMYCKKNIVENKIKFEENLKYEDVPFVIDSILFAKKIGKVDECLTYYCIHGNSETTIRDKRMFDILKITELVRKKIITNKKNIPVKYINHLIVKIITNYTVQQRYQKNRKLRIKFINESFSYLKKNVKDYKNNKYYNGRGFLKRTIEKNKLMTIIYCDIYNVKK